MRPTRFIGLLASSAIVAIATLASPARADDNFDVQVTAGRIVVTARDGWHINQDYSWSVKKGGDKVKSKEDFQLEKGKATVSGLPSGTFTLKGAVCSENACAPFSKENITIQ